MTPHRPGIPGDFDLSALWVAVDAQCEARAITWRQFTKALAWMSPTTADRMRETGSATCNHVLPMIQWVGRTPESFTIDPDAAVHELLPDPQGPGDGWDHRRAGQWRWWWNNVELASELDLRRQGLEMTWKQIAEEVGVPLRGIQKSKYGPPIGMAMVAARWLQRSAASFMTDLPPAVLNA